MSDMQRTPSSTNNAVRRPLFLGVSIFLTILVALLAGSWLSRPERHPRADQQPVRRQIVMENSALEAVVAGQPGAVVLSLAGGSAGFIEAYITDGTMRNLALLAAGGMLTEHVVTPDPPTSIHSHMGLASGRASTIFPGEETIPIWMWGEMNASPEEERRRAVLFWPGAKPAASADDLIIINMMPPLSSPSQIQIPLQAKGQEEAFGLPDSYSTPLGGEIRVRDDAGQHLVTYSVAAVDNRDDGQVGYDALIIWSSETQPEREKEYAMLWPGSWAVLRIPNKPAGVSFKLLAIESPSETATGNWSIILYQAPATAISGQPEELAVRLVQDLGPPAPAPDFPSFVDGLLTSEDYMHMAETHLEWKAASLEWVLETYRPQLTLAAWDIVEQVARVAPPYSDGEMYDPRLRSAYRWADRNLGLVLAGLDLSRTTLLVGSPYGVIGAQKAVSLPALLSTLLTEDDIGALEWEIIDGGLAYLFLSPGIDGSQETTSEEDIVTALVHAHINGAAVFRTISTHVDSGRAGHRMILLQASPGIFLAGDGSLDEDEVSYPIEIGAGGYPADLPATQGAFVLAGRGVPALGLTEPISLFDLAPTLADLLGLSIPAGVEGRAVAFPPRP